jgi:predicted esterase
MPNLRHEVVHVETHTHGRVLTVEPSQSPAGLIVALHGYGQSAADALADLQCIPAIDSWRIVAPQGLHRFYTRDQKKVVASWMTREDRELAVADNIAYVDKAIARGGGGPIVCVGFSQGAAMAYRAARLGRHQVAGVIALGGDIPPEVRAQSQEAGAAAWPAVLIGAGARDVWYNERLDSDVAFLTAHGIAHEVVRFDGGHEWTAEFGAAAGRWLNRIS